MPDREMSDREYKAIYAIAARYAREEEIRSDDDSLSFGDRVQPDAFAEALDAADEVSAADISDVVWEAIEATYGEMFAERY